MLETTIAGSLPKPAWLATPLVLWAPWQQTGPALADAKRDATLLAIKEQVDADPRPGRYLLTGSARLLGLRGLPDTLPGRTETIELWPLAQGELDGTADRFIDAVFDRGNALTHESAVTRQEYAERIVRGGFPEAAARANPRRRERFFDSYLADLVARDVSQLSDIERTTEMRALIRLLAGATVYAQAIQSPAEPHWLYDVVQFDGSWLTPAVRFLAVVALVWLCVSDTAAVEKILFGSEGVEPSLAEGTIIADSSTISPSATVKFAERVRGKGVAYVDAPMTGSKIGAANGTLIFMVGGDGAVIDRLNPLFAAMGKKIFRMGETGKGQATKLAMNLQIALIFEGFAEALTLATKLGVDPRQLLSLIEATMVRSGVVDYKAPFILQRDFTPNFPLRLMHKDILLTLEAAKEARVKLPALETVEEIYEMATEDGHRDLDYAATITLLEKWAGVQVKSEAA